MDKTLITDFFGGVSQAEVLTSDEDLDHSNVFDEEARQRGSTHANPLVELTPENATPNETAGGREDVHGYIDLLSLVKNLQQEQKRGVVGSLRTWLSSGLMFALIAWVSLKK